jgi:hypothetical protein
MFEIEPCDDIQQFTSFAAAIDLTSASVSPVAPVRGHARWLRVEDVGSGTLAVKLTGSGGTTRTLTVTAGDEFDGKFVSVETTTTVARLSVGW